MFSGLSPPWGYLVKWPSMIGDFTRRVDVLQPIGPNQRATGTPVDPFWGFALPVLPAGCERFAISWEHLSMTRMKAMRNVSRGLLRRVPSGYYMPPLPSIHCVAIRHPGQVRLRRIPEWREVYRGCPSTSSPGPRPGQAGRGKPLQQKRGISWNFAFLCGHRAGKLSFVIRLRYHCVVIYCNCGIFPYHTLNNS